MLEVPSIAQPDIAAVFFATVITVTVSVDYSLFERRFEGCDISILEKPSDFFVEPGINLRYVIFHL